MLDWGLTASIFSVRCTFFWAAKTYGWRTYHKICIQLSWIYWDSLILLAQLWHETFLDLPPVATTRLEEISLTVKRWIGATPNKGLFSRNTTTRWWFQIYIFYFHPYLGEDSHFDVHIFQRGWNHQLDKIRGNCWVVPLSGWRW